MGAFWRHITDRLELRSVFSRGFLVQDGGWSILLEFRVFDPRAGHEPWKKPGRSRNVPRPRLLRADAERRRRHLPGLDLVRRPHRQRPCVGARPPVVIVRVDGVKPPDRHIRSRSGSLVDGTPLVDNEKPPKAVDIRVPRDSRISSAAIGSPYGSCERPVGRDQNLAAAGLAAGMV